MIFNELGTFAGENRRFMKNAELFGARHFHKSFCF